MREITERRVANRITRPAYPKVLKMCHASGYQLGQLCACCDRAGVRVTKIQETRESAPVIYITCILHSGMSRDNLNNFMKQLKETQDVRSNTSPANEST